MRIALTTASLEKLENAQMKIAKAIEEKRKSIALSKSGYSKEIIGGKLHADANDFTLAEVDFLFAKWYLRHVLIYTGIIPKYVHQYIKSSEEIIYLFADRKYLIGDYPLAILIHKESLPYLEKQFEKWLFELSYKV